MQSFYTDPVPAKPCRSLAVSDGSSSEDSALGLQLCQECQGKVLIVSLPILVMFNVPDG